MGLCPVFTLLIKMICKVKSTAINIKQWIPCVYKKKLQIDINYLYSNILLYIFIYIKHNIDNNKPISNKDITW